jgi:hypothetical protein
MSTFLEEFQNLGLCKDVIEVIEDYYLIDIKKNLIQEIPISANKFFKKKMEKVWEKINTCNLPHEEFDDWESMLDRGGVFSKDPMDSKELHAWLFGDLYYPITMHDLLVDLVRKPELFLVNTNGDYILIEHFYSGIYLDELLQMSKYASDGPFLDELFQYPCQSESE